MDHISLLKGAQGSMNHKTSSLASLFLITVLLYAFAPAQVCLPLARAQASSPMAAVAGQEAVVLVSPHYPAAMHTSPLLFIENAGQWADGARFQMRGGAKTTVWLAEDSIWFAALGSAELVAADSPFDLESAKRQASQLSRRVVNIKLSFVDANSHPTMEPFNRLDTVVSYFLGSNPEQWRPSMPAWGGVRYVDLYPGVDLELASEGGQLVLRLAARPGADLSTVRLRVEGADALELEGEHLHLDTPLGGMTLPLLVVKGVSPHLEPVVSRVDGAYEVITPFASPSQPPLAAGQVASSVLNYSTYLGGSGEDRGYDIAVDSLGHVYVTGQTASVDFPTTPGAYDLSNNDDPPGSQINDYTGEVFISKLSADGSTLLYSTYLGGNSEDAGYGIAVDDDGKAFLAGKTYSTDFPTTEGALDTELSGGRDAFVAKLNATGDELIYSTYLGGSYWEYGLDVAVDPQGYAYVTGFTHGGFPTTPGVRQPSPGGSIDGFVVKLNLGGTAMVYSTYLGGSLNDGGESIAVDDKGHAYITGGTHSTDFPIVDALQPTKAGGVSDAFVVKLDADASDLVYSTYLGAGAGGNGGEAGYGIVIDNAGNAYVTGATDATGFPTVAPIQPDYGGGDLDAFLAKINADGSALIYSTYYGGNDIDRGLGIGIDIAGAAYITGYTSSTDLVTVYPLQANNAGGYDAFLAKANHRGSAWVFSSYLGGSADDNLYGVGQGDAGIAVGFTGKVYLTGLTASVDFPTTQGALNTAFAGGESDAFVARLDLRYRFFFPLTAGP
jgi:hypothetical protein